MGAGVGIVGAIVGAVGIIEGARVTGAGVGSVGIGVTTTRLGLGVGLVDGKGGIFGFPFPEVAGTVGEGVTTGDTYREGAGVRTQKLGAGVATTGTTGEGVIGRVGEGVTSTGACVIMVGCGVGITAGIAPSEPAGVKGMAGDVASNRTSQPMHAPGAQVNERRATS